MSYRVVFRPQAQAELLEARDWYEARQENLGVKFSAAIDATVSNIRERPLAYPRVHNEIRRAVLQRFPTQYFSSYSKRKLSYSPSSTVADVHVLGSRDADCQ